MYSLIILLSSIYPFTQCLSLLVTIICYPYANKSFYRPASEASREIANLDDPNLTEIKNPHPPVYGVL